MKKIVYYISILVFICALSSCKMFSKKPEEKPKETLPKIESIKDATDYHNKRVTIEGIYTQVDIRIKRENPAVLYSGQVALKLKDNTLVFIYPPTSPEAKRTKKEIKDMSGQEVRVVGMIFKNMPTSDHIKTKLPPAIVASPYVTYIEKMELINPPPPKNTRKR